MANDTPLSAKAQAHWDVGYNFYTRALETFRVEMAQKNRLPEPSIQFPVEDTASAAILQTVKDAAPQTPFDSSRVLLIDRYHGGSNQRAQWILDQLRWWRKAEEGDPDGLHTSQIEDLKELGFPGSWYTWEHEKSRRGAAGYRQILAEYNLLVAPEPTMRLPERAPKVMTGVIPEQRWREAVLWRREEEHALESFVERIEARRKTGRNPGFTVPERARFGVLFALGTHRPGVSLEETEWSADERLHQADLAMARVALKNNDLRNLSEYVGAQDDEEMGSREMALRPAVRHGVVIERIAMNRGFEILQKQWAKPDVDPNAVERRVLGFLKRHELLDGLEGLCRQEFWEMTERIVHPQLRRGRDDINPGVWKTEQKRSREAVDERMKSDRKWAPPRVVRERLQILDEAGFSLASLRASARVASKPAKTRPMPEDMWD